MKYVYANILVVDDFLGFIYIDTETSRGVVYSSGHHANTRSNYEYIIGVIIEAGGSVNSGNGTSSY